MNHSTDRILTTHAGSLPRPADVRDLVTAKSEGKPVDAKVLDAALNNGVADVVRLQIESGIDTVNDGELAKSNFSNYAKERPGGFEIRQFAPGTIEHWLKNAYYANDEEYVFAIADAMHEEYKAIVDAGLVLQIDDPDLADGWQLHLEMSVAEYRSFAELRIDALNHALRDLPREQVRFHMCWGSYHGPHKYDIPLKEIVDIILEVKAESYSIEASNPCHAHEWQLWEDVKLPNNTFLVPGVVGHHSDFIEHPELVAERLVQYAKIA